jgi:CRISPR-associated endonuclease/helicase Cas3
MITECAPIDAMIQRFGRINRKRTDETIGKYKDIYVIKPPEKDGEALPYDLQVLQKSFDVLPDGKVLNETELQTMIDTVYPDIPISSIDYSGAVFVDGKWRIKELCHNAKSALLDVLDINSAVCITFSDREEYENNPSSRAELEIPVSYKSIGYNKLDQVKCGSRPFVVPDDAYNSEKGLMTEFAKPEYYKTYEIL